MLPNTLFARSTSRLTYPTALLVFLLSLLAGACDDDGGKRSLVPEDAVGDGGADVTDGSDSQVGTDTRTARDTGSREDTGSVQPDTRVRDTGVDMEEDVVELTGDDFACNLADRIAACEAALLTDMAPMPEDPDDLLFYVNRWYEIPADYPISSTSTWIPCYGGDPGVEHDLVCIPPTQSTKDLALRQPAWESDAPANITTTHDGLPVGHNGKIGYKAMFDAAREEAGYDLFVLSGFRSYATQEATFNGHVNRVMAEENVDRSEAERIASTFSAQPGHSEHQLGTTADITYRTPQGNIYPSLDQSMANAAAIQWVHANSHRFGIVLTYDEDKVETTQYVYEPWHHRFVGVEAADAMRECMLNTEEFLAERYGVGPLPEYAGESIILFHNSSLRRHVTLPPASWVRPGETFTKTWRIKNTGSINWHNYRFSRVGGQDVFGGTTERDLACVRAGDVIEISLELTAPSTPGTYEATWQVLDPGGNPFGDEFPLNLIVSDQEPDYDPYLFVRVDDISDHIAGFDPGADIDAVVLTKAGGGTKHYATTVESYSAAPSDPNASDPTLALGAPDAFYAYPDTSVCNVDSGFVSLGGAGTLVLGLDTEIEATDTLEVLEIGGCAYGTGTAVTDEIQVQVSVAPEVAGQWVLLGRGDGPSVSFAVPELPPAQR